MFFFCAFGKGEMLSTRQSWGEFAAFEGQGWFIAFSSKPLISSKDSYKRYGILHGCFGRHPGCPTKL